MKRDCETVKQPPIDPPKVALDMKEEPESLGDRIAALNPKEALLVLKRVRELIG